MNALTSSLALLTRRVDALTDLVRTVTVMLVVLAIGWSCWAWVVAR